MSSFSNLLGNLQKLKILNLNGISRLKESEFSHLLEGLQKSTTIFDIKLGSNDLELKQRKQLFAICRKNRDEYAIRLRTGSLALLSTKIPSTGNVLPLEIRLRILKLAFPDYPADQIDRITEQYVDSPFYNALIMHRQNLQQSEIYMVKYEAKFGNLPNKEREQKFSEYFSATKKEKEALSDYLNSNNNTSTNNSHSSPT